MPSLIPLVDISDYHSATEASLRLYYSSTNPSYQIVFASYRPSEVADELRDRIIETEVRSILVILARLEASFRTDYLLRVRLKKSDNISIEFRKIHRRRREKARLDEDILEIWRQNLDPTGRAVVSKMRSMLHYRHWLAHGRYWQFGGKHTYSDVYLLADTIMTGFGLQS